MDDVGGSAVVRSVLLTDGPATMMSFVLLAVLSAAVVVAATTKSATVRRVSDRHPISRWTIVIVVLATVGAGAVVAFVLEFGLFALPNQTTAVARDLLREYGVLALFVLFVIEGGQVLYFAPSESLVPAAVVLLVDSPVGVFVVILVAVAGSTLGQCLLFSLAKYAGRDYLLNARWFHVGEDRLRRFEAWFERWGPLAVPISNTLLFVRGLMTVPAGLAGMRLRRFAILSALGTLSFEVILAAATIGLLSVL
ncbi:MAG: DedA family protein [Halorhabdus sp.]